MLFAHLIHPGIDECLLNPPRNLGARQAEVLRPKGHLFLDRELDQLVIRVLENDADVLRDFVDLHAADVVCPQVDTAPHVARDT